VSVGFGRAKSAESATTGQSLAPLCAPPKLRGPLPCFSALCLFKHRSEQNEVLLLQYRQPRAAPAGTSFAQVSQFLFSVGIVRYYVVHSAKPLQTVSALITVRSGMPTLAGL
jgi:hypothetical protein